MTTELQNSTNSNENNIKEQSQLNPYLPGVIMVVTSLSGVLFISVNLFIIITLLLISIYLFQISKTTSFSLLLKLISISILLHLIIFPNLYLLLIHFDKQSIIVNNDIVRNESEILRNDLNTQYDSIAYSNKRRIIPKILLTRHFNLDTPISTLNDNIIFIDSFLIHKARTINRHASPSAGAASYTGLSICDSKGQNLISINGEYGYKISSKLSWREYLEKELDNTYLKESELQARIKMIEERDIWTYSNILPYSINVLDSDNLTPRSRLANMLNFIHRLIFQSLILGFIVTAFWEFINEKFKQKEKNKNN